MLMCEMDGDIGTKSLQENERRGRRLTDCSARLEKRIFFRLLGAESENFGTVRRPLRELLLLLTKNRCL